MLKQNRAMEFYRFISAVLILCYHCYWFAFQEDGTQFVGFYLLVELFFILSGFLMMSSVRRHVTPEMRLDPARTTWAYVRGRLRQFYPQHILSWVLVALIMVFVTRQIYPIEAIEIGWTEVFLVNIFGFVRGEYMNIVCWYLSATIFASLILYFLVVWNEDVFVKIIAPILLIFCIGTLFDRKESLAATIIFTRYSPHLGFYRSLADMTIGILAFRAFEWMKDVKIPGEAVWSTLLELAVFVACGFWMYSCSGKFDYVFLLLFFAFVISVFRGKSLFTRIFDNKVSGWLGKVSFAYFLNNLVVIYPYMYLFPESGIWPMIAICVPACFVISVITTAVLGGFRKKKPTPKTRPELAVQGESA